VRFLWVVFSLRWYYTDSVSIATYLNIDFICEKKGLINSVLLKGSEVSLNSILTKRIKIIE